MDADLAASGRVNGEPEPPAGLIVAYYRVDPTRRLLGSLGWGSLVMAIGSVAVALGLYFARTDRVSALPLVTGRNAAIAGAAVDAEGRPLHPDAWPIELGFGLVGLGCIGLGGAIAIVGLNRVLREEAYLALRTDGALAQLDDARSLLRWEDVATVRWEPARRAVVFERHDGEAWVRAERYAGIDGPRLAARAAEIRRKALFGLL